MLEEPLSRPQDAHLVIWIAASLLILMARRIPTFSFSGFLRLAWYSQYLELASDFRPLQSRQGAQRLISLSASLIFLSVLVSLHSPLGAFDWLFALRVFLWLNAILLIKFSLALLIGWVFDCQEILATGQNIFLAHLSWLQFPLLFLLVLAHYLPSGQSLLLQALGLISLLGLVFAWWREGKYLARQTLAKPQIIFYLCALEITPFLYLKIFW